MVFACETTSCGVRGRRKQLGLARIHIRRERYERAAQIRDRPLVSRFSRVYENEECKDEKNAANHLNISLFESVHCLIPSNELQEQLRLWMPRVRRCFLLRLLCLFSF